MTLQAEGVVTLGEHLRVDGAVDVVAGGAAFADSLVVEHMRAGLLVVALGADLVDASHGQDLRLADVLAVRIVAGDAGHSSFLDGMVEGEAELGLLVDVTLEAGFGVLAGIDDEPAPAAAGVDVEAAGAVATFAALPGHALLVAGDLDASVLGEFEILNGLFMAGPAGVHADVLGTGDHGWRHHYAIDSRTRNCQRQSRTGTDTDDE